MSNWAKLDRVALNGIIEYLDHAEEIFPDRATEMEADEIRDLLVTYTHLVICCKTLLLNTDPVYRERVEKDLLFKVKE
jgi:hypothetical protein